MPSWVKEQKRETSPARAQTTLCSVLPVPVAPEPTLRSHANAGTCGRRARVTAGRRALVAGSRGHLQLSLGSEIGAGGSENDRRPGRAKGGRPRSSHSFCLMLAGDPLATQTISSSPAQVQPPLSTSDCRPSPINPMTYRENWVSVGCKKLCHIKEVAGWTLATLWPPRRALSTTKSSALQEHTFQGPVPITHGDCVSHWCLRPPCLHPYHVPTLWLGQVGPWEWSG